MNYVQEQLEVLERRSENPVPLDDMESDAHNQLLEVFGEAFAVKIARDGGWARRLPCQSAGCRMSAPGGWCVAMDVVRRDVYCSCIILFANGFDLPLALATCRLRI